MKLYILRHAVAEPGGPDLPDAKRKLTQEGRAELMRALNGLKKLKVQPAAMLSSPYPRAWETAVAAAQVLLGKTGVIECAALKPEGTPAKVWAAIRPHAALDSVMIVGHEPLLTEFAAFVLSSPNLTIKLKKSGLIRIDLADFTADRSSAELRWLLTPGHLCTLAR